MPVIILSRRRMRRQSWVRSKPTRKGGSIHVLYIRKEGRHGRYQCPLCKNHSTQPQHTTNNFHRVLDVVGRVGGCASFFLFDG